MEKLSCTDLQFKDQLIYTHSQHKVFKLERTSVFVVSYKGQQRTFSNLYPWIFCDLTILLMLINMGPSTGLIGKKMFIVL